jgi:uncharacterized membrane protein
MTIFLTLAIFILALFVVRLTRRVSALEDQLSNSHVEPQAEVNRPVDPDHAEVVSVAEDIADSAEVETSPTPQRTPWGKKREPADGDAPVVATAEEAPTAYVFKQSLFSGLWAWITQNWFLAVAALSLALAGVFLVQYGVESGLLTPFWRVAGAAALGIALLFAGEVLRRKWGDEDGARTAYLPSTFAGAGLVALYAAVISARQLYGMTGPGVAFAEMVSVSLVAVVFGWFYGPFLAVVGIVGAVASPFVVGGSSDTPELFYYYFALIALAGLLIDALRRWAWTSVLSVLGTHAAAWYIYDAGAGDVHYLVFAFAVALSATLVPPLKVTPTHAGATVLRRNPFRKSDSGNHPEFPTRLAFGGFAGAVAVALVVGFKDAGTVEIWSVVAILSALFLVAAFWNREAPALIDLPLLAPAALLLLVYDQGIGYGTLAVAFDTELPPESPWPKHVTILWLIAVGVSTIAFWRSQTAEIFKLEWTTGAAVYAPLTLIIFEIWWRPALLIGDGVWAFHAMAVAALMALFTERAGRQDADDRRRAGIFALASMTMIAFALILMLSETALTIALTVMVLGAVALDRWQKLPALTVFVQIGLAVVTWRLVLDPGLLWAMDAPMWEIWMVNAPVIVQLLAAWYLLDKTAHPKTRAVLETTLSLVLAVFVLVLVTRALGDDLESHWGIGLCVSVGLLSMAGQLYMLRTSNGLRWAYWITAMFYALLSLLGTVVLATIFNPLANSDEVVLGPNLLDSLLLAYGPIALILGAVAYRFDHLRLFLRRIFGVIAALTASYYVVLEIRRFWRGDILAVSGTTDAELYSYTVALLLSSIVALFVAFARRSVMLRRVAVFGVGLTIAKVFLIDMAGLAGLMRVASFLGLGLSLAGLAWVNRRMTEQWGDGGERDMPETDTP